MQFKQSKTVLKKTSGNYLGIRHQGKTSLKQHQGATFPLKKLGTLIAVGKDPSQVNKHIYEQKV